MYDAHLSSRKHIKAAAKAPDATASASQSQTNGTTAPRRPTKHHKAALATHLLLPLLVPLVPTLQDSKSNVERRFALTARERELEAENEPTSAAPAPAKDGAAEPEAEEEEEERIYNPLKLPLGWDGKPIPYWLYKLHGLGVEYRCEICSDGVYMGRKNFERHFQVCSGCRSG